MLRVEIADVLGIANIADIVDIADIGTDIADIATDTVIRKRSWTRLGSPTTGICTHQNNTPYSPTNIAL